MKNHRRLMPLLTAVLIGIPVLYVGCFGPACWLVSRSMAHDSVLETGFSPVISLATYGPEPARSAIRWWCKRLGGNEALDRAIFAKLMLEAAVMD